MNLPATLSPVPVPGAGDCPAEFYGANVVLDALHQANWTMVATPEANVHATSPAGRLYLGWLPEDHSAFKRGALWNITATFGEGWQWTQEFGADTPYEAVRGFVAGLIAHGAHSR